MLDTKKVVFYKKVASMKKFVPEIKDVWNKLGLSRLDAAPVFSQVTADLTKIVDRDALMQTQI